MISLHYGCNALVMAADRFDALEFPAQVVDPVGDEREQDACGLVSLQRGNGAAHIGFVQVVALEIDACESVNLEIEESRMQNWISLGFLRLQDPGSTGEGTNPRARFADRNVLRELLPACRWLYRRVSV